MLLSQIMQILGNIVFVFAPCIGFIPQIVKRKITFAPILSTIVILANVMKLLYWQSEHFPLEIVLQSVFLVLFHFVLLYLSKQELSILEEKLVLNRFTEKSYRRYGMFSLIFSLIVSIVLMIATISLIFRTRYVYTVFGPLFLVAECSVGLVQLLIIEMESKYSLGKEVEYPRELFLMWALGDILKLIWTIKLNPPVFLIVSVVFQIMVDVAVVFRRKK
ncbi:hypothetical protein VCUG_01821 [Vavraia culicis subsp. floridensis]|uniref:Uncharacterized protein n=1 Tax=Vavraia culicis (isolate floridensis) TaxID=948595 RepID=L2GSM5_VAVCU|nr:uncharacterized protein VCUG_01821 [Vavraia culicis subsp. floridensis]ELA46671.1 hypothetical protein VCUG_01821 [Vavraia culicis subsp. floridensis]